MQSPATTDRALFDAFAQALLANLISSHCSPDLLLITVLDWPYQGDARDGPAWSTGSRRAPTVHDRSLIFPLFR
jgi:hypothetical protein